MVKQQHFALKALFGGDILEPARGLIDLDDNCHVLDVGCGPGSWLLDLATSYPNSKFVGIDVVDMVSKKKKKASRPCDKHKMDVNGFNFLCTLDKTSSHPPSDRQIPNFMFAIYWMDYPCSLIIALILFKCGYLPQY
jgi:SAM-dependent methyltransferase